MGQKAAPSPGKSLSPSRPCPAERIWLEGGYWSQAHLQGEGHGASGNARGFPGDITSKDVPSNQPATPGPHDLLRPAAPGSISRLSPGTDKDFCCPLPGDAGGWHSGSSKYRPLPRTEADLPQLPPCPHGPPRGSFSPKSSLPPDLLPHHWLEQSQNPTRWSKTATSPLQ